MNFHRSQTNLPVLLLYNIDLHWLPEEIKECVEVTERLAEALREVGHQVTSLCLEDGDVAGLFQPYHPDEYIVFNWCEEIPGIPRSCFLVAHELEMLGFTFTGSDSCALSLSQNKHRVKRLLRSAGITTPHWQLYTSPDQIDWEQFPAIVKLAFEHSSIGISRESVVQSRSELVRRAQYLQETYRQPVLIEEFIDGREFHIGVVGNGLLQVLPPAEIDFSFFNDIHDRLCTYESNFDQDSLAYQATIPKLPAQLSSAELDRLEKLVSAAYRVIGCRDYARMDVRLRDGCFYVLDVNTNADICPGNSLTLAAEMVGYSYGEFGSLLLNLASKRHPMLRSSR